jgi:nucleotide-binding universal stress UspA family protein
VALVVGYDRHPASRAALLFAGQLAGALNVPLHVVHVADASDSTLGAGPPTSADDHQLLRAEQRSVRAALESTGVQWSYHVMSGDRVAALIEAASEHAASMIIVGRPEHGIGATLGHIVSGAVARGLLRRSPRPVVVVPESANGEP